MRAARHSDGGRQGDMMDLHGGFSPSRSWLRVWQRLTAITLLAVLSFEWALPASAAIRPESRPASLVRLPGHVLDALKSATPMPPVPGADAEPLTLTVTLKRADQAGFDRYLHDVYDSHSPRFRPFLTQSDIAARFGPSQKAYDNVLGYMQHHGFTLLQGSPNRLTMVVKGSRAQAEQAFDTTIRDYRASNRIFHANATDPALPAAIA